MADYYPLIARAVAALPQNTDETRRALYDRARNALLAQLRGRTPALSESEVMRERQSLESAIRRLEMEINEKLNTTAVQQSMQSRPRQPAAKHVETMFFNPAAMKAAKDNVTGSEKSSGVGLSPVQGAVALFLLGLIAIGIGLYLTPAMFAAGYYVAHSSQGLVFLGGAIWLLLSPCLPYILLGFAVAIIVRRSNKPKAAARRLIFMAIPLCALTAVVQVWSQMIEHLGEQFDMKGFSKSPIGFAIGWCVVGFFIFVLGGAYSYPSFVRLYKDTKYMLVPEPGAYQWQWTFSPKGSQAITGQVTGTQADATAAVQLAIDHWIEQHNPPDRLLLAKNAAKGNGTETPIKGDQNS